MAKLPYSRRRGDSIVFRRRVPIDLQASLHRGEIVRSLGTCAPREARRRSRLLWAATERVFDTVRELPTITQTAVEKLMATVANDCAWADEVQVARSGRYFDVDGPAPADFDALRFEAEAIEFWKALARNDIAPVREQIARYAGRLGLALAPGSLDERIIGRAILRGFAEASGVAAVHARATDAMRATSLATLVHDVDDGPAAPCSQPMPFVGGERDAPVVTISDAPVTSKVPPSRFAGLTIRELWPSFCEDQVTSRKWKQKIAAQSQGTMRAWVRINGDGLPTALTSAPAAEFRRVMRQLPGNYAKCSAWQGLSFAAIIAQVAGSSYKPVAITTLNRHLSVLTAFHDWALRNELTQVKDNPVAGLWIAVDTDLDIMDGGSQERSMWSEEQLQALLSSPLFLGCQSPARRHKFGSLVIRDVFYWVVLIAMLSGMRREEICQLRVRHVVTDTVTGIVYFDLKARGLELKNTESKRWVPLHDDLITLGFLVERVEDRCLDDRLFLELQGQDNFGDKLGKQLTRYRKNLNIYEPLLDFHSFRHTVSTLLIRAGIPQAYAEEITGHRLDARRTAFAIYDKKATLPILKNAIDAIKLPVCAERLLAVVSGSRHNSRDYSNGNSLQRKEAA